MIVIKFGGSAITDKSKDFTPRLEVLESAASQLARVQENVIIVHGGGSFGHPLARQFELQRGFQNQTQLEGVSKTRYSMTQLNQLVLSSLMAKEIPAVALQPSACFVCKKKRISLSFLDPVRRLLELKCTPVLYGDVVTDTEIGFCILSGDQIVSYLAEKLHPRKVIFGLDKDGLYNKDPVHKDAVLLHDITYNDLESISAGETGDVTAGMKGKLSEIVLMRGTEVNLITLLRDNTLLKACQDTVEGTRVR